MVKPTKDKRKERQALLRQLDILRENSTGSDEDKEAFLAIGQKLDGLANERKKMPLIDQKVSELIVEKPLTAKKKYRKNTVTTVDQYHEYKKKDMSDLEICQLISVSPSTLKVWKREHGIKSQLAEQVVKNRKAEKSMAIQLTVAKYQSYLTQGLKDKQIAEKVGVKVQTIYSFKHLNGLTSKHKALNATERAKANGVAAPEKAVEVEPGYAEALQSSFTKLDTSKDDYTSIEDAVAPESEKALEFDWSGHFAASVGAKASKAVEEVAVEEAVAVVVEKSKGMPTVDPGYDYLKEYRKTLDAVAEKLSAKQENERKEESYENERLQRELQLHKDSRMNLERKVSAYTADYNQLEVKFLNSETEVRRLREMLEKVKETAQINVWLMKQHVGFVEQLDTLIDSGEVSDPWR